jgi:hypothetical protein
MVGVRTVSPFAEGKATQKVDKQNYEQDGPDEYRDVEQHKLRVVDFDGLVLQKYHDIVFFDLK